MLAEVSAIPPHQSAYTPLASKPQKDPAWILPLPKYRPRSDSPETRNTQMSLRTQTVAPRIQPTVDGRPEESERQATQVSRRLEDLPIEIQEGVLDVLAGNLNSTSSSTIERNRGMRNWSNAMRHPRRRQLSDLSLVSKTWRRMIQERLYRHGMAGMEILFGQSANL